MLDFFVVSVSLLALAVSSLTSLKSLRLLRPFRVLRVFSRLVSLRMLVNAIIASIAPVFNALVIVMVWIAIYAVLGVSFFSEIDPVHFGGFRKALFTMFQVLEEEQMEEDHLICPPPLTLGIFPGGDARLVGADRA